MEIFIELLKEVNIAQIFILLIGGWFFYSRLDRKIEKLEEKVDKLSERVYDVDKRLCRIEGGLESHGHCLFHQNQPERKAE